jgi:hypothetical protein
VGEWIDQDGAWFRTTPFELETDEQTVQIDVTLRPDGGVIRVGQRSGDNSRSPRSHW